MSEADKRQASIQVFDRSQTARSSTSSASHQNESNREVTHQLLIGDELDLSPRQTILFLLERGKYGSVFCSQVAPSDTGDLEVSELDQTSTDQVFDDFAMEETAEFKLDPLGVSGQLKELWTTKVVSESEVADEIFQLRELRAKQWNQILPDTIHFEPLSEEQLIYTRSLDLASNLAQTLDPTAGLNDYQEDLLSGDDDPFSTVSSEPGNDHVIKVKWCSSDGDLYHYPTLPPQQTTMIKANSFLPEATTLSGGTESEERIAISKSLKVGTLKDTLDSFLPIFNLIRDLHRSDYVLGGFDPSVFRLIKTETKQYIRPFYPLKLFSTNQSNEFGQLTSECPYLRGEETTVYTGYSPPEMFGYFSGTPSKRSDVFSAGMMLYYFFTGCPRFPETRRPFAKLPSPIVYRQDIPPEMVAVVNKAISPVPSRRHEDMVEFLADIEWAIQSAQMREEAPARSLSLEAGHEIHVGLLKGQYNPVNQDDLFLGYQSELDLGLFVVTDGVSICEYGSGDLASSLVREEAVECWRELNQAQSLSEDEETLSEVNLDALSSLSGGYGKVLSSLVNKANERIGDYVNQYLPAILGPPEGVMAATIVAAIINQGVATLTSVGDSRIYLVRDGHITSLMYDEDLFTHLLQARQSPSQAQQNPSAPALIHCVGEFTKDDDQKLKAVHSTPQIRELKLLPGDTLVLCSDGLPDYSGIDEEHSEELMCQVVENALTVHHAAFELITLANRGGGGDNLSCIIIRLKEGAKE